MAIAPFPHRYKVELDERRLASGAAPALDIGPPPQFGGTNPRDWSPEDLLLGAVAACFKTTFDAYARRAGVEVKRFHASAEGVLEKTREGPAFSIINLVVELDVDDGVAEKARETAERAERDCIISRAVKPSVALTTLIRTPASDAAAAATTSQAPAA